MLQHSLGYFKKTSGPEEKQFFLSTLEEYMKGSIPLMVPVNIIKSWILRDKVSYLAQQSFFTLSPVDCPAPWIQQSENESISNSFTLS